MSKQLSLPLKTHPTRACRESVQSWIDPSWINEFVARYEAVERYERKKKSKQYEKTVRLQK